MLPRRCAVVFPFEKSHAGGAPGPPKFVASQCVLLKRHPVGRRNRGLGRQNTSGRTSCHPFGADEFGDGCFGLCLRQARTRSLIGHRRTPPPFFSPAELINRAARRYSGIP